LIDSLIDSQSSKPEWYAQRYIVSSQLLKIMRAYCGAVGSRVYVAEVELLSRLLLRHAKWPPIKVDF